jgi:hypothetical protein
MYPCPTKSSESNDAEKVFTSRKDYDRVPIVARVPRVGHRCATPSSLVPPEQPPRN